MKNKKNIQKIVPTTYECPICREEHDNDLICPIIAQKRLKMLENKRFSRTHIMGAIFLEYLKRKLNFARKLREILYVYAMSSSHLELINFCAIYTVFDVDYLITYFCSDLKIKASSLLVDADKLSEEFVKEISDAQAISDIEFDDNIIKYIMEVTIDCDDIIDSPYDSCNFFLYKIIRPSFTEYLLVADFSTDSGVNIKNYYYHFKPFSEMGTNSIILASGRDNALKKFFEDNYNWWEYNIHCNYNDDRFKIWIKKIRSATERNLIEWNGHSYKKTQIYNGNYGNHKIRISSEDSEHDSFRMDLDYDFLIVQISEHNVISFGPSYPTDIEIGTKIESQQCQEIRDLCKIINRSLTIIKARTINTEEAKELAFYDTIVKSYSWICQYDDHYIKPYIGKIPILRKGNTKDYYYSYLGFCTQCRQFLMFSSDYEKMLQEGTPLCNVIEIENENNPKQDSKFQYSSQSILNAMGYNVQKDNGLSTTERQEIISIAIQKKLIEVHDTAMFLEWLIRTRSPMARYKEAVRKWEEDLEFVKKTFASETHDVKSITVRSKKEKQ